MLSKNAMYFMEQLAPIYKETGCVDFEYSSYFQIPNHEQAIEELCKNGYITKHNDVIGTITINIDFIKG